MEIIPTLCWELIDPILGINYNRNVGLVQDADHSLLVVDAGI